MFQANKFFPFFNLKGIVYFLSFASKARDQKILARKLISTAFNHLQYFLNNLQAIVALIDEDIIIEFVLIMTSTST